MILHSTSDVQSKNIGKDTSIWQFCVVLSGAVIEDECNICSHRFIENNVKIGNRETVKNNVSIYDEITIEDDVFIGPSVTFGNDKYPKSKNENFKLDSIIIKKGASIVGKDTILPGVTIGENALIGAGSIVTKNVPANSIIKG